MVVLVSVSTSSLKMPPPLVALLPEIVEPTTVVVAIPPTLKGMSFGL